MIKVKKEFSQRDLLLFGPLFALFCGLLGWLLFLHWFPPVVTYVFWAAAAVVIGVYYAVPSWRRSIYLGWLYAVMPIGWVVSHLLLIVVYYLILTPCGLLMRLVGYDPLHRKFDPQATTYWIEREPAKDVQRYFRQS